MTKEEFKGFSLAAQHDMVLEALVRVTKNLETMEKENGKPFVGTAKQRRNDVKLLTILADAFGKNELVWAQKSKMTRDDGKMMPRDEVMSQFALYTGLGQKVHEEKPKPIKDIKGIMDAKEKIEGAQQRSGHFMSCENNKES